MRKRLDGQDGIYVATWLIVFVGGERKWFDVVGTPIGGINALAHGAME